MAIQKPVTYQDAGVSIDEADRAVSLIRKHARGTFTRAVLTDIGSFGGGYLLSGWKNPVLVSSADGVGTKVKIAFLTGRHNTIGEDLVNHCVNDIAVQGAIPLFSGLFRRRQAGRTCCRSSDRRHCPRLPQQWMCADRRRDGRNARAVSKG
jgi:phosphoribosylaminoimidazole (AIR) synthetase